ncbi:hypothetical protein N9118_12025 [Akkermansiaceae bacterium]|nr:hypothetical protein [Akkermansiaceae bacterium]
MGHKTVDLLADSLNETRKAQVPVRGAQTPEEAAQYRKILPHCSPCANGSLRAGTAATLISQPQ